MVLGFKKQFKEPILAGTKLHSIREDLHDRWRPGLMIQMATGTRSKYYDCFKETPCQSTQRISMKLMGILDKEPVLVITISARTLVNAKEYERVAINDGFENFEAFEKWWKPVLAKLVNFHFSGKIIHWTDLRY